MVDKVGVFDVALMLDKLLDAALNIISVLSV